jgi:thiol-disulfide isomerase/thioredoxin
MAAEYYAQAEQADASQRVEVQANWLKSLEKFVSDFPQSEDAADAMLELAMAQEFAGKLTEAKDWYTRLAADHADSQPGTIATGALRRFNLKGQPLTLAGPALGAAGTIDIARYRGKVVAVMFWATWCIPCTEDLPQVQELYRQYKADGFEVLGVNIDDDSAPIQAYLRQHKIEWPSIHETGGRQSGIAQQYGVITLPTTFLVDKSGKVVSASTTVADLKKLVPELVKQ